MHPVSIILETHELIMTKFTHQKHQLWVINITIHKVTCDHGFGAFWDNKIYTIQERLKPVDLTHFTHWYIKQTHWGVMASLSFICDLLLNWLNIKELSQISLQSFFYFKFYKWFQCAIWLILPELNRIQTIMFIHDKVTNFT